MKILLDSGVWWRWVTNGPMHKSLSRFLEKEVSDYYLCPVSILECYYKVAHRREPEPEIKDWKNLFLEGYKIAPISFEAAKLAGNWEWEHGDPCDRLITAVAAVERLPLVHTDKRLERLTGFPQRYFQNIQL